MIDKCVYRGIKLWPIKPGDTVVCPLCEARLVAIDRNGRAFIPAHERKLPKNSWMHYGHRSGGTL